MIMPSRLVTILLLVLGAALAIVVVALALGSNGGNVTLTAGVPKVVSADQLSDIAADSEFRPLYWLGEREGSDYEVTETAGGRFYLRYLTNGAGAGDKQPDFLTVGTYRSKNGAAELRQAASEIQNAEIARTDDGAILLIDPSSPKSAHLAYPGGRSQIEIYSPIPGQALRIAKHGKLRPIR